MKWFFRQWQDGDIALQKTVTLAADVTLTAYYVRAFTLIINSSTPYPVSFTIDGQLVQTPFGQILAEGTYVVVMPLTAGNYQFQQWSDGDTNPTKNITLTVDTSLTAIYQYVPPPPGKGTVDIHAFLDSGEVIASVEIVGVGTYTTPFTLELDAGTYTVNATFQGTLQTKTVTVIEAQTTTVNFQFGVPPCIIATISYGTPLAKEVSILRSFRDNFMARTSFGRWLTHAYYNVGKYIAKWLMPHIMIKRMFRGYLDFIVRLFKMGKDAKP